MRARLRHLVPAIVGTTTRKGGYLVELRLCRTPHLAALFLLGKIVDVAGLARITAPTLDVLEALLRAQSDGLELHGWGIMKSVRRSGPTVYGVLDRLEDAGWVEGRWEQGSDPGKPRRRYYRLTGTGMPAARDLLAVRRPDAFKARPARPVPGGLLDHGSRRAPGGAR